MDKQLCQNEDTSPISNTHSEFTGAYAVGVKGSPQKMVVLSAKNNEMLAHLFKASANYLANSP